MNKFWIIRDTREKDGYGWNWSETEDCFGTKRECLSVGDYSIENFTDLIFIDRKESTSEFSKNITEKRFLNLLEKIKNFKYKYLIMNFDLEDIYFFPLNSGIPKRFFKRCCIKPAFLESWLIKISIDYGVQIIFAGNAKQGEQITYSLLKKIYKLENTNV